MSENKVTVEKQIKKFPNPWIRIIIEFLAVVVLYFLWNKTVDFAGVNERGLAIAKQALVGLLKPSLKVILDTSSVGLGYMLLETVAISFLGTLIGLIVAFPLAFIASRNVAPRWINYICLTVISIIRAFPTFIYGIMFVRVTGPGAAAGVLTMAISSVGMLSKLLIETIEDINPGIVEALDAAGCTPFQKIRYGIIPQVSSNIISIIIYRLDINVKSATTLGVVGAGGIGASLIFSIAAMRWGDVSAMLLGLIVTVLILEYVSTKIRGKLANG